jgi:hypothetical protein
LNNFYATSHCGHKYNTVAELSLELSPQSIWQLSLASGHFIHPKYHCYGQADCEHADFVLKELY